MAKVRLDAERSLGDLFSELAQLTSSLFRQEAELAKTELVRDVSAMGKDAGFIAAGAFVAYAGFLAILSAIILALATVIEWWLAALIVGVVVALAGYLLVQYGINRIRRADVAPRETLETLGKIPSVFNSSGAGTNVRVSGSSPGQRVQQELRPIRGGEDVPSIRGSIDQTRVEIANTIDEIEERLNPSNLASQASSAVRDATVGRAERMMHEATDTAREAGDSVMDTIKENPLPSALVGLGLGWLLVRSRNRPSSRYQAGRRYARGRFESGYSGSRRTPYYEEEPVYGSEGRPYGRPSGIQNRAQQVGEQVQGAAEQARETASNMASQAQDMVGDVRDQASQAFDQAGTRMSEFGEDMRMRSQRMEGEIERLIHQSPLAAGAVAFGIGAAIGLAFPSTRQENQILGEARDDLVGRAQQTLGQTQDRVEHAVQKAGETLEHELESQSEESKSSE